MQDWPYGHRIDKMIENVPIGNGLLGIMESFDSKIFFDDQQAVRWWERGDYNDEIAGAVNKNNRYPETASHIGDWLFSVDDFNGRQAKHPNRLFENHCKIGK